MILIEGMGWFGAITALALDRVGIPFRWCDNDSPFQAWRASTGIVYPAGDDRSRYNLALWDRWVVGDRWLPSGSAQRVVYGFAHKAPPHNGRYEVDDLGWIRAARGAPAIAVNPQYIVGVARERFADWRVPVEEGPGYLSRIVAWNPPRTRVGWVWGWSRKVRLALPPHPYVWPLSLYGKTNRFNLTYAYPVAGEGWWYAGSALVNETLPRARVDSELDVCWGRWRRDMRTLFPGVKVLDTLPIVQGWRPKPAKGDSGAVRFDGRTATYPALWHSGVRWAPSLVLEVVEWARSRQETFST